MNEEKNIENCLNCLLEQIEKPLEIIVVDNNSKDNTCKIVDELKTKFKKNKINLRLLYCKIGNQTNARELGIKMSKGNIIGSLDADALANKDWIFKISKYFEYPDIDIPLNYVTTSQ